MYRGAEYLVSQGLAYVDEQSPDDMRANRGDFGTPGKNSPFRDRTPEQHLTRLREMRDGKHPDGSMVLRAKIDMASPNINLRDPALYRIRRATHHNTGDQWCIYPMYTYAHPIEDALEYITHSVCTLEFEDQRPFYDWLVEHLAEGGLLARPLPHQYEFGRLNLTYVVTSKRKLRQLVEEGHVDGWDDPRMPTLVGMRRRGYTPEAIRAMVESTGASKTNAWIDYSVLDGYLRADLEGKAARAMAVLDPVKLKLENYAEIFGSTDHREPCSAPAHPHVPELGTRAFSLGPELWIEREDFMEVPSKGYHRLFPGNKARLKYGYVIECTGCEKDADGTITAVLAKLVPDTKSGTPGADAVKVKGVITWVGAHEGIATELRLYDRLFTEAQPDAGDRNFLELLNPDAKRVTRGYLEPSLKDAARTPRSSSSGTATSSPIASTIGPTRRCSTRSPGCGTASGSKGGAPRRSDHRVGRDGERVHHARRHATRRHIRELRRLLDGVLMLGRSAEGRLRLGPAEHVGRFLDEDRRQGHLIHVDGIDALRRVLRAHPCAQLAQRRGEGFQRLLQTGSARGEAILAGAGSKAQARVGTEVPSGRRVRRPRLVPVEPASMGEQDGH